MAVTIQEVQHIAALSRLSLDEPRASSLVAELNTILAHMDVLSRVDTEGVQEAIGIGASGLPVRSDSDAPVALERPLSDFAPSFRDGLLLVPRLSTHESADES